MEFDLFQAVVFASFSRSQSFHTQLIVNELRDCIVLRNNPPKWWITLLKRLRSAANYERIPRVLNICLKTRQI